MNWVRKVYIISFNKIIKVLSFDGGGVRALAGLIFLSKFEEQTGKKIFDEFDFFKEKGFDKTGTENFGGVTATAGNIVIATGTLDKKIYVFDSTNGKTLYKKTLPFIGSAPPSTYLYDGEQYIILHASGGTTLKRGYPNLVKTGNKLIAFKLNM